jgi:hypothetical protein
MPSFGVIRTKLNPGQYLSQLAPGARFFVIGYKPSHWKPILYQDEFHILIADAVNAICEITRSLSN